MKKYNLWEEDLKFAKEITNQYAKSFSAGIKLFPKDIRNATYSIYLFVRLPDNIIDETTLSENDAKIELTNWINNWNHYYYHNTFPNPAFRLMKQTMEDYNIPKYLVDDFFGAMIADTNKNRYHSYQELKDYMHGSAAVIGEMMAIILGADKKDIPAARALGEAFQLTNFLRDIKEDYKIRNRIYIPNNILIKYNCSHNNIEQQNLSPEFIEAIKYIINYNKTLYNFARTGINSLNPKTQFGIILATNIYEAILNKIEKENYNIFKKRIHTKTIDKIIIFGKTKYNYIKNKPKKKYLYSSR